MKNHTNLGTYRGSGRFQEALNDAGIDLNSVPIWDPFSPTPLKPTGRGVVMVFDIVPLKFKQHFPIGLKGKIKLFKNKRAIRNFSVILTISEHARNDIISYFSVLPEKVHVVHLPVGKAFLTTSPAFSTGREGLPSSYALYVGDVNWNKNLPTLAKAIKLGDTPCVFVGKPFSTPLSELTHPWQKSFKEFLELAKDDPKFILKGYVSDEELVVLYKNALCNILVSQDEGFGYSYIEAASQGTPSILSYIPVFKETAGETALFADPNSPQDIADKLKSLVADKLKRDELGKQAKVRVLERYTAEEFKREVSQFV